MNTLMHRSVCVIVTAPHEKGEVGIGVPKQLHDESRGLFSAESAASLSVPPVLAARMGGRKARRFPQGLPGTPTHSSCRLRLASRAAVVANRTAWMPIMALSSGAPAPASSAATTAIRLNAEYLDTVLAALAHADAMANMTCGNSGEAFRCMIDELQDEFLRALANRIDAARKAADRLSHYITQGATA